MALYHQLKSHFPSAQITQLDIELKTVELLFKNAKGPILIREQAEKDRYSIEYPKLKKTITEGRANYTECTATGSDLLMEGVLWVIQQVKKNGAVLPEILD